MDRERKRIHFHGRAVRGELEEAESHLAFLQHVAPTSRLLCYYIKS